ncbi:MAG TPA: hypothetical protein VGU45_11845 [Microvirga sp.]|jgi:hypothetical protein|nr:hypothetical protein [Microvirga sp.]
MGPKQTHSMACPHCDQDRGIQIECKPIWSELGPDGEWRDVHGREYGTESPAACPDCDWSSAVQDLCAWEEKAEAAAMARAEGRGQPHA